MSSNHAEIVMGNTRGTIGRVCRWRDETNQMARWMGVSLLLAPERIQAGAQARWTNSAPHSPALSGPQRGRPPPVSRPRKSAPPTCWRGPILAAAQRGRLFSKSLPPCCSGPATRVAQPGSGAEGAGATRCRSRAVTAGGGFIRRPRKYFVLPFANLDS